MKRTILTQYSKDAEKRGEVVRELAMRGDPSSLDVLCAALMDEDCFVRWRAAVELGHLQDVRAAEPLVNALNDREPHVRQSAAGPSVLLEKVQ